MFVLKDLSLREVELGRDPNGYLLVFVEPDPLRKYFIGVDVGTGSGLSNSVIHVVQQGDLDTPDIQVAEFACDFLDPHQLAPVVDKVGRLYWSDVDDLPAEVAIEVYPGPGEGTQYDLITFYEYPNLFIRQVYDSTHNMYVQKYGWNTSAKTKKQIVNWGVHQYKTDQWIIHSPWMLDEMIDFHAEHAVAVSVQDSEFSIVKEATTSSRIKSKVKSDRVMAGLIAEWTCNALRVEGDNPAVIRARREEEKPDDGVRRDFQNTAISYDDMWKVVQ